MTVYCEIDYSKYMNKKNDEECQSNLQCLSACCKESKCTPIDKCKTEVKNAYIAVGIVGIVFLLAGIGYFIYSIMSMRNEVKIRQKASQSTNPQDPLNVMQNMPKEQKKE